MLTLLGHMVVVGNEQSLHRYSLRGVSKAGFVL